ncbi:MAG TPA: hypothetical protein PKA80_15070, partial [Ignavibacteriaceae bacterium]|nr:hypothetical protein [Ignavibacteriaceae bacterium]
PTELRPRIYPFSLELPIFPTFRDRRSTQLNYDPKYYVLSSEKLSPNILFAACKNKNLWLKF